MSITARPSGRRADRRLVRLTTSAFVCVLAAATLVVATPAPVSAAVVVPGEYTLASVTTGLQGPSAMKFTPDGRLFVLEQVGRVRVVQNGALLATAALTLPVATGNSKGLIGLVFDPAFASNGFVYFFYTVRGATTAEDHNRISRFTVVGNTIGLASEVVLVEFDALGSSGMHYGGDLAFGADGKLYATTGDNLKGPNSQSFTTRFGKLLRYNPDGSIPTDNPFLAQTTGVNQAIYALGVRNGFRLTVSKVTGQMLIGDVGSAAWEEVNEVAAGANYGWPNAEGPSTDPAYTNPLFSYPHTDNGAVWGCAVMGGDFYEPATPTFPAAMQGKYFFADHCNGWLRTLDGATGATTAFADGFERPVDFKVAPDGSLYTLQRTLNGVAKGVIYRITYNGSTSVAPTISAQPNDITVAPGGNATFSVTASGTSPLSYQWRRNGTNITGATSASYTKAGVTTADTGSQFSVVISNPIGSVTSRNALLTVSNNQPPAATIVTPVAGTTYVAGNTYTFSGKGTDAEDGTLPASAFEWEIIFHHNTHTHPFVEPTPGVKSFTQTIDDLNETATDVFYRVHLRVTDSAGVTTETTRDLLPRTVAMKLATDPAAGQITLDGTPTATPFSFTAVQGILRDLSAPPRTVNGVPWVLDSWEDDSTAVDRTVRMPTKAKTYTAFYRVNGGSTGTGTGLRAQYFTDPNFTTSALVRTDRHVHYQWGTASPVPGTIGTDNFSIRWTGDLQAQFTQKYTIFASADAKVRVTIGGVVRLDTFATPTTAEVKTTMNLVAGQRYPIKVDYSDDTGSAKVLLRWSSPSTPKSAIPGTQLYAAAG